MDFAPLTRDPQGVGETAASSALPAENTQCHDPGLASSSFSAIAASGGAVEVAALRFCHISLDLVYSQTSISNQILEL